MPLRIPRVIVRWRARPTWRSGPPEEQPGWDEHAELIDGRIERGVFVTGGPHAGNSGSPTIWEGVTAGEVRRLVQDDPFVRNGVLELEDVRDWTLYVDARLAT